MFAVHRLRTYVVFEFVILLRAKPRPSKKACLDKATEEDVILEPGKTPNLEAAIPEDIPNDPPQQDDDLIAEERPTDASGPVNQPTSSIRIEKSTGPAKPTDKPTAPVQTGDAKDDEVVITGIGHTEPGNPVALSRRAFLLGLGLALRRITKLNTTYVLRQYTTNIIINIAYPSTVLSGGS